MHKTLTKHHKIDVSRAYYSKHQKQYNEKLHNALNSFRYCIKLRQGSTLGRTLSSLIHTTVIF